MALRVFISAGELSGDIAAARLIAELRRRAPGVHVFGAGGVRMAAAGADLAVDTSGIGVIGVSEAVRAVPAIVHALRTIRRQLTTTAPDVAVLIGNDLFNVLLARWLRARGVPTASYFPPQVWIWRALVRPIAHSFDTILTSFPEEHAVYSGARREGVEYVGHYLASDLQPVTPGERATARTTLGVPPEATVVALLPGSRRDELTAIAPRLLDSAGCLLAQPRDWRFLVAAAPAVAAPLRAAVAGHRIAPSAILTADSHLAMRAADLVLVASGTASLEAALLAVPMIITYRVSLVTYLVARAAIATGLLRAYVVGLPNLILERRVVPEVLQYDATPQRLAAEAWALLSNPDERGAMRDALVAIGDRLRGPKPLTAAADAVLRLV